MKTIGAKMFAVNIRNEWLKPMRQYQVFCIKHLCPGCYPQAYERSCYVIIFGRYANYLGIVANNFLKLAGCPVDIVRPFGSEYDPIQMPEFKIPVGLFEVIVK